ncbi:hypothetical protein [Streptomyces noursei]|uniref:hypothetical protein n=1 Tax=Streptomyces noursei TaxID=1971 RepID=UPI000C99D212|nr:hypothetical protein [Streptomyces noursei]
MSTTASTDKPTVFHAILNRLTARDIRCQPQTDVSGDYATYHFADGSHITWGAHSNTGVENSIHPITAHSSLNVFHNSPENNRDFETGDYATDSAALIDWVTTLAERHGRAPQ